MKKILFAAIVGLALSIVGSAQDKTTAVPNFSGDWEMDMAKSTVPASAGPKITGYKLTVTQHPKTIDVASLVTLDSDPGTIANSRTFNLDGTESDTELKLMQMSAPAKIVGKWLDGRKLELSMHAKIEMGEEVVTASQTDVWELADGGKTLSIHRVRNGPGGSEVSDLVFVKK